MTKRMIQLILLWAILGTMSMAAASEPSALVRCEPIRKMLLTGSLKAYGLIDLDPRHTRSISFPHAGVVSRLMVNVGQCVQNGSPLLEFSTDPAESFAYSQAASAVDYAKRSLDRTRTLVEQKLATQAQLAAAEKALADARATLDVMTRQGKGTSVKSLVAPFDGIVMRLDVKSGERVPAGVPLLHLSRTAFLMADLGIEPEDVARISKGMTVHIRTVFDKTKKAEGRVSSVDGIINPQTRLVDVQVEIPGDQADHFIPGMQVLGEIILGNREYWVVPRSAVLYDREGAYVFQIDPRKRAHRVNVTLEEETDHLVAISGGFDPQMPVVVQGNYELQENMPVREEPK
ncbi:efflux RND transporter periplasmic adaptor subunit [Desulfatirhabdium butyrativorans]|uniref:efflux RND transporter periplasmic adaptor subunit n=1 Tax=Desulfatirhabdium butyrativorans TaxID=340467 RepID=UPI000406F40B|nr:efflux RND transporter periplasmic adaptor subunit [Desulfatirhabdium butyrativorans]